MGSYRKLGFLSHLDVLGIVVDSEASREACTELQQEATFAAANVEDAHRRRELRRDQVLPERLPATVYADGNIVSTIVGMSSLEDSLDSILINMHRRVLSQHDVGCCPSCGVLQWL